LILDTCINTIDSDPLLSISMENRSSKAPLMERRLRKLKSLGTVIQKDWLDPLLSIRSNN
jgi:hypothetical protein